MNIKILSLNFTILLFLIVQCNTSQGQRNMVANPGFEQYRECPEKHNSVLAVHQQVCIRWFTVSEASPDYFNTCSKSTLVSVPKNFAGVMKPHGGNGYIGLILKSDPRYYLGDYNYTEHIQNKLVSPLKKDKYYCFEIWIAHGKNSTLTAQDFGVYFSKEQITFPNPPDTLPRPHLEYQGEHLTNSTAWTPLRGLYKAEGGERYLTIGNFKPWEKGRFDRIRNNFSQNDLKEFAYYLFDDVSLVEIKDTNNCSCNMVTIYPPVTEKPEVVKVIEEPVNEFENVQVGEAIILNNIFFEFDKTELLPESFTELNKLVDLMNKYPSMTIEIAGHTDGMGSSDYNKNLSTGRAKSVVNYLISEGIGPTRLTWVGYGKEKPIADNTTDEGRQLNRRVEFKILSKD